MQPHPQPVKIEEYYLDENLEIVPKEKAFTKRVITYFAEDPPIYSYIDIINYEED